MSRWLDFIWWIWWLWLIWIRLDLILVKKDWRDSIMRHILQYYVTIFHQNIRLICYALCVTVVSATTCIVTETELNSFCVSNHYNYYCCANQFQINQMDLLNCCLYNRLNKCLSLLDSDRSRSKKKKKRSEKNQQRSLSPALGRRIALLKGAGVDPSVVVDQAIAGNNSALNYSQIFGSTSSDGLPNDYELRVSSGCLFEEKSA